MLNILKGSSKSTSIPLSFTVEDIKSIVEAFKIEDEAQETGLIILRSGDGVTSRDHITREIKRLTAEDDHIGLENLAQRLDVTVAAIRECHIRIQTSLLNHDEQRLRSQKAALDIAKTLHNDALSGYVDQVKFLRHHDISSSELQRLLSVAVSWAKHEPDCGSLASPCTRRYAGREYITVPSVDTRIRSRMEDNLANAVKDGQSVTLTLAQFPGLSLDALEDSAAGCLKQLSSSRGQLYQGRFLTQDLVKSPTSEQGLRFIPDAEDNRRLTSAALSFFDSADSTRLGQWIERHSVVPDLLPSSKDALKFVQTELRDNAGDKINVLVERPSNGSLQDVIVTDCRALDKKANEVWQQHRESNFIDIAPHLQQFTAKGGVKDYLMERILKLAGSDRPSEDRPAWETAGTFIYTSDYDSQFSVEVDILVKTVASDKWMQTEEKPASKLKLEKTDMFSKDGLYSPLLPWTMENRPQQWATWQRDFTEQVELRSESAFADAWRDRLSTKLQLYSAGLGELIESPLKDQLSDLLRDHITEELVPQTAQRGTEKARGFVTDKTSKRLAKFRSKLKDATSLDSCVAQINKFEEKNSPIIEPLSADELRAKQSSEVSVLYKITRSDKDAARRFLCAVLILLASRSRGVLYATGRSAPKLLKTLADSMDVNEYKTMEVFKDEAKKGSVSQDTSDQVDTIVQRAMQKMGMTS